jgi:hypothetical protein
MLDPVSSFGIPREDILIVDNSLEGFAGKYGVRVHRAEGIHNIGVARAWNVGAREVLEKNLDYLVIVSTSMYFGPVMYHTFMTHLQTFKDQNVIEATGHGWHLIALHRRLFEAVGLFDENFYPAYFEDVEWSHRLRIKNLQGGFNHVWINAITRGVGLHARAVTCLPQPLMDYYAEKWGGGKENETFNLPFGDKPIGYFPDYSIPELISKYGLTTWW